MKARTDIDDFTKQLHEDKQRKQSRRKSGRTETAKKPPLVARFLSSSSSESPAMATPPKRLLEPSLPPAPRKKARPMPPQNRLSPVGLVFAPPPPQRAPAVLPVPPPAVSSLSGKHGGDGLMLFGFEAGRFTDMTMAEAAEAYALLPAAKKAKLARRQNLALAGRAGAAEE